MSTGLLAARWDAEYRAGRYADEPPLPFVSTIVSAFFLRVTAASTEVWHRHTVVERHPLGGFTIRYEEGPKRDLLVHFYTADELLDRTRDAFSVVVPSREDVIRRELPKTGSWAQWEGVWRRR